MRRRNSQWLAFALALLGFVLMVMAFVMVLRIRGYL